MQESPSEDAKEVLVCRQHLSQQPKITPEAEEEKQVVNLKSLYIQSRVQELERSGMFSEIWL